MRKELIVAASAFALLSGAAFAQSSTPGSSTTTQPPAQMENQQSGSSTMPATPGASSSQSGSSASMQSGADLSAMDMASLEGLIGKEVMGTDGESLGEVEDVILDPSSQKAQQVVISSGGFLGIGDKQIAVEASQIRMAPGEEGNLQATGLTQASVESLPEFEMQDTMTSLSRARAGSTGGTSGGAAAPGGTGATNAPATSQ